MCVGVGVRMQVPSEAPVVRSTDVVNCLTWVLGKSSTCPPVTAVRLSTALTPSIVCHSVILRDCLPFTPAHPFSPSSTELCPAQRALAFTGSGLLLH